VRRATCQLLELTRAPLRSGRGCASMELEDLRWPTYWTPQVQQPENIVFIDWLQLVLLMFRVKPQPAG
jgi:hypothetical protein